MLQLDYKIVDLPYKKAFETSHGTKSFQRNLYVKLAYGPMSGYGACPVISYSKFDEKDWIQKLEAKGAFIRNYAYNGPLRFWHFLHHLFPNDPYLVSALDAASWDMWSKMQQSSVTDLLGLKKNNTKATDITIGIGDNQQMCDEMKKSAFGDLKIKWSSPELQKLKTLTACTDARLRLDLNEAWSPDLCQDFLTEDFAQQFDIVEQPCKRDVEVDFRSYSNPHQIKLIADESFQGIQDLEYCAAHFHGINVKLPKCGGLTAALDIIKGAEALGLCLLLGNMSEGGIGTAALVQIASAFDYLDIDGFLLLDDPDVRGIICENGVVKVQHDLGLGIDILWSD